MKELLHPLFLIGCISAPAECKPQIEAVKQKCQAVGPLGSLEPELAEAKKCIGGKIEAVCVQHNVAEPRQVEWKYN